MESSGASQTRLVGRIYTPFENPDLIGVIARILPPRDFCTLRETSAMCYQACTPAGAVMRLTPT